MQLNINSKLKLNLNEMNVEFVIILFTFLTAVPAAFGTTDTNGRINYRGFIAILLAIGLGVGSYFKYLQDEKEKKEKDEQITQLSRNLEIAKSELSKIDTNVMTEKRQLYPAFTMNLGKYDTKPIPVPLVKGMSIKILNQNSDNSLFFTYANSNEKHIQDSDIEFPIREEVNSLGCCFCNKSDMICSVTYEVWGTLEMQLRSTKMHGIPEEDDSPIEELDDERGNQPPKQDVLGANPVREVKSNNNAVIEKFFVSIGCYASQEKEQILRSIFKLDDSEEIIIVQTGRCFRYLVGQGNDSFNEANIRCNYIKKNNPDCFVMSISYSNGSVTGWKEFNNK